MTGGTNFDPWYWFEPSEQSYRAPGFSSSVFWDDPTPLRAVDEIRADPTVTPPPPAPTDAMAALRSVPAVRANDAGGGGFADANDGWGGGLTNQIDPTLSGQPPSGLPPGQQLDAIGQIIGNLIGAQPTGNTLVNDAMRAGSFAPVVGTPIGMGSLALAQSHAPYNPDINPWADVHYDQNGVPISSAAPVPASEASFLPSAAPQTSSARVDPSFYSSFGLPTPDQLAAAVPAAAPAAAPTGSFFDSLFGNTTAPGRQTASAPGDSDFADPLAGGPDIGTSGGQASADKSEAGTGGGAKGTGDNTGAFTSGDGSVGAFNGGQSDTTAAGATAGGTSDNASSAGSETDGGQASGGSGDQGGASAGSGDNSGNGGSGSGDNDGSGGGAGSSPYAKGGPVKSGNRFMPGNPHNGDTMIITAQPGEFMLPRPIVQGIKRGDPGSAMAALQGVRAGQPPMPPGGGSPYAMPQSGRALMPGVPRAWGGPVGPANAMRPVAAPATPMPRISAPAPRPTALPRPMRAPTAAPAPPTPAIGMLRNVRGNASGGGAAPQPRNPFASPNEFRPPYRAV
jgi:hypothetical protein